MTYLFIFCAHWENLIGIRWAQMQSTLTILGAPDGHFESDFAQFMEQGHQIDGYRLKLFFCKSYKYILKTLSTYFDRTWREFAIRSAQ